MVVVSSGDARKNLSDIVNRAKYSKEKTIITNNGKQVAAVISMDDLKLLERLIVEIENESDLIAAKEALTDYEKNGGISWNDAMEQLGY
jgi:prevent-host-death family protein